jgi:hypothetical protein
VSDATAGRVGRRRFLQGLGTAGVTTALGTWFGSWFASEAGAQGKATPPPTTSATPPPPPTPPTPPSAEARAEADAQLAILRARVGASLQAADEPALREELLNAVQASKTLRATSLANGLDPDTIFRARELDT